MPPSLIVSKEEAESALCAACYETFDIEEEYDERKPVCLPCGHIIHIGCLSTGTKKTVFISAWRRKEEEDKNI